MNVVAAPLPAETGSVYQLCHARVGGAQLDASPIDFQKTESRRRQRRCARAGIEPVTQGVLNRRTLEPTFAGKLGASYGSQ